MTDCFLVRHADAGKRGVHDDARRGISKRGRAQADALVEQFHDGAITAIASSPYARCVETVAPLAAAVDVDIEIDESLGEGCGPQPTIARIEALTEPTVLCSHGDVIGEVMHTLAQRGVVLEDDRIAKGSTWLLTVVAGDVTAARYLPPPT